MRYVVFLSFYYLFFPSPIPGKKKKKKKVMGKETHLTSFINSFIYIIEKFNFKYRPIITNKMRSNKTSVLKCK
jgi:hypothetical protein